MKKQFFILLLTLFSTQLLVAQVRNCQSNEYLIRQLENNPERAINLAKIEQLTRTILDNPQTKSNVDGIVTIPVVIHVVYANSTQNISEAQIQSQLDVLNEDFRRLNSDANNTWSQAADSEIEFCLATVDPDGNPTSGITRTSTNANPFSDDDKMKFTSQGGTDVWDAAQYMNVWVCELAGGILGYAQFPGGPANTDGVVCDYRYFGTTGTATAPFDLGRTMTHEVGHYLNLYHIWGDGGCNVDDLVNDTPNSDGPNFGCDTGHSSCSTPDMIENYMDYSDDGCMNLYTVGQKDRMRALFAAGGARESLINSTACGGGGGDPTCSAPTGLAANNATASTADISWNAATGAQSYDLQYRVVGTTTWTTQANISGTTYTLSGLSDCTDYQVKVRTDCGSESSSFSSVVTFSTTGCPDGCQNNEVTLTIVPDDYGSEITWEVKDGNNVLYAGGPYTDSDNTPVEVALCLDNGCYDFVIYDAYGDGICCSWGDGSYSLTDAAGNTLASGAEYGSSETKNFCIGGGGTTTGDAGIVRINRPAADHCGADITPRVRIKNFDSAPLTSVLVNYNIDGGASQSFSWTGTIAAGATENVDLPAIITSSGTHVITASTSLPNGGTDANSSNDGKSKNFNAIAGEQVKIQIKPDDYGSEITWILEDDNGNTVAAGGPYTDNDNTVKTAAVCLEDGCYTFTIYDAYGDGICCNWGTGWYRIRDAANQNIVYGNGQYGSFESQTFCIGGTQRNGMVETDQPKVPALSVYPNPSRGAITVEVANAKTDTEIKIFNTLGELVETVPADVENGSQQLDLTNLPNGVYFVKLDDGKKPVTQKIMIFK